MEVKIENGKLFVEIDLQEPTPSASGKTLVVATTHGNVVTDCVVDGKPLVIGLNAYVKKWHISCLRDYDYIVIIPETIIIKYYEIFIAHIVMDSICYTS